MIKHQRLLALITTLTMILAACGGDEGGEVRDLGADGTATGSEPGSASGSASGSATGSASGGSASGPSEATVGDGGYDYATDVASHRLVVRDVCEIKELLDQETIDYAAIATIYAEGKNSVDDDGSVRSLSGFATADDRLHGLDTYYGTPTPLDDFVSAAIAGEGLF